jgi:hypothetical protein
MSVFAQRHSLGTLQRHAFAELADARGGFKGLCLPLFIGGELRAAKYWQEHILEAGEVSGLELLLEYGLQFGVVDLDGLGRLLASFRRKGYRQFCHVFQLGRLLAQAVLEKPARDHFFFRSLRRRAARIRFTSSTTV